MIVLAFIGLIGLGATFLLPTTEPAEPRRHPTPQRPTRETQAAIRISHRTVYHPAGMMPGWVAGLGVDA
jgi:hypothetical protein